MQVFSFYLQTQLWEFIFLFAQTFDIFVVEHKFSTIRLHRFDEVDDNPPRNAWISRGG
jgi:hypothetical protein